MIEWNNKEPTYKSWVISEVAQGNDPTLESWVTDQEGQDLIWWLHTVEGNWHRAPPQYIAEWIAIRALFISWGFSLKGMFNVWDELSPMARWLKRW